MERLLEAAGEDAQEPEWVDLEPYRGEREIDETVRKILARGVRHNPRQAKRALNAFRLLQAIALVREARAPSPLKTSWPILAKVVVLQTQYPEVYKRWLEPGMEKLPVHLERALEETGKPLAEEAPQWVQEVIQGLLQDPVRFYQLWEVLTYSPAGKGRTGRGRARFIDLELGELEWYRRLAAPLTVPSTAERAALLEAALASADPMVLWQAALDLRGRLSEEDQKYARWLLLRDRTLPEWARQGALEILSSEDHVPFLIGMLNNPDARRAAAIALGKIGDPRAVPSLLEALQDADEGVRRGAREALVRIGAPAVPGLLQALWDADEWVRREAAWALGRIGDSQAVPGLLEALRGAEWWVRQAAVALERIGAPAVPGLLEALRDADADVRGAVEKVLAKIGAPAVPGLLEALRDADKRVRGAAAEALRRIGDPRGLKAVR
ncbi:MAG: HEAT repeat domain-containing protein [Thermoflexales bacterium]|nr:HEAT repeat domain-containing protein [Thermoflexales bacterium]